jgi:hypothetical protein
MRGALILFAIAAFFKITLFLLPAREQLYIFYKMDRGWINNLIITTVMCFIVFGVPCVYPDVTKLLGLVGGITSGTAGYSLPVTLKLASLKKLGCLLSLSGLSHLILLLCILTIQLLSVYVSLTQNSGGSH